MSRRKQAKPRSLKGHDARLNVSEHSVSVDKKRYSWERKTEKNEGKKRQGKDECVSSAESKQPTELITPQSLMSLHSSGIGRDEASSVLCWNLSSPDHADESDLGFTVEDLPKCTKGGGNTDDEMLVRRKGISTLLSDNSSARCEISRTDLNGKPIAEKRSANTFTNQPSKKLKALNNCVNCVVNSTSHAEEMLSASLCSGTAEQEEHHNKEAGILESSMMLEAAITATVQTVLQCRFCPTSLKDHKALQEHVRQSHNPVIESNVFFCSQCFRGFLTKSTLESHMQKTHSEDQEVIIERKPQLLCALSTHSPKHNHHLKLDPPASKRIKTSSSTRGFTCDHCGATYTSPDLLQSHLSSHTRECVEDSITQNAPHKHTLGSSSPHACESCGKSCSTIADLQKHLLEMHTLVFYRCSLCQKVFSSRWSVEIHLATEHSNIRTTYSCTFCERDFRQESHLHLHVKEKHLDKTCQMFLCLFCSASFNSDVELQCHITTHSDSSSGRTPECHVTTVANQRLPGKADAGTFQSRPESEDKVSLNDQMFACGICGASYTLPSLLHNHQLRDHRIPPEESRKRSVEAIEGSHRCKDCSRSFFTETALWEHVQTHLGPTKLCQCPICGERFPSLLTLTEHKVTHSRSLDTGTCRICRLPLRSQEDFLEHCQTHPDLHNSLTGFRCVVCMQNLTSTLELKIHGTFHMQKVQDVMGSLTSAANRYPGFKISHNAARLDAETEMDRTSEPGDDRPNVVVNGSALDCMDSISQTSTV